MEKLNFEQITKQIAQDRFKKLEKVFSRQGKATKSQFTILSKLDIKHHKEQPVTIFNPELILDPSKRNRLEDTKETQKDK
jgi:hypothetical protein